MCYAYKPVKDPATGKVYKVNYRDFRKLEQEGIIKESPDGYFYAKATVPVIILEDDYKVVPMRWDLVPRDYLAEHPEFDLAMVIRKKNSRAKNPDTQRPWGFDSFNARAETLTSRPAFRQAWKDGQRCVMPAIGFQERANMEGAPKEFQNRSWAVDLDGTYYMGGIYDVWERKKERLESCSIITMDSEGHEKLRAIWHERHPLILREDQVDEWLDPDTTTERARQMVMQFDPAKMTLSEIIKKPKAPPDPS